MLWFAAHFLSPPVYTVSPRNWLAQTIASCGWALVIGGCSAPWGWLPSAPIETSADSYSAGQLLAPPDVTRRGSPDLALVPESSQRGEQSDVSLPTRGDWDRSRQFSDNVFEQRFNPAVGDLTRSSAQAPDLGSVIDTLQHVRQIDPAAEQRLLGELRNTPAASWPLVAEQFRASLAYHVQLTSGTQAQPASLTAGALAARRAASSPQAAMPDTVAHTNDSRPSEPFGRLVDPRKLDASASQAAAPMHTLSNAAPMAGDQRTSVSQPTDTNIPADFVHSGPVYPISSHRGPLHAASEAAEPNNNTHVGLASADSPSAVHPVSANVLTQSTESDLEHREFSANGSLQAASDPPGDDWREHVAMAVDSLDRTVSNAPTSTAEIHQHVSLRILRLLLGDTESALKPIPHISPTEQDFWSGQLYGLAVYLDHHAQPEDKRRALASVSHLDKALSSLRELGLLSVRNLSFCKSVYGYGAIEPYDQDLFTAGQQVSLYVEVENYHSRATAEGYCTSLGSTYEILDGNGTRVAGGTIPDVNDCCRNRRRDFHIEYGLQLPDKLAPGKYRLDLVIKDRQSDKIGHATAGFEIGGVAP